MEFNCGNNYGFNVQIKSPMGWVKIIAQLTIDDTGAVTGVADAPRHRPMEIKGELAQ